MNQFHTCAFCVGYRSWNCKQIGCWWVSLYLWNYKILAILYHMVSYQNSIITSFGCKHMQLYHSMDTPVQTAVRDRSLKPVFDLYNSSINTTCNIRHSIMGTLSMVYFVSSHHVSTWQGISKLPWSWPRNLQGQGFCWKTWRLSCRGMLLSKRDRRRT